MWRLIPGPIRRAVSWLLGAIAFAFVMRGIGRREGRQKANTDALRDQLKSDERGRNAVAKEKRATDGADADDILKRLRARDGDWM